MTRIQLLGALTLAVLWTSPSSAFAFNELFLANGPLARLKKSDVEQARAAIQTALESEADNEKVTWSNPATNASGTATATKTFVHKGMRCRSARFTVNAGGQTGSSKWNLCKTDDGWKILN